MKKNRTRILEVEFQLENLNKMETETNRKLLKVAARERYCRSRLFSQKG